MVLLVFVLDLQDAVIARIHDIQVVSPDKQSLGLVQFDSVQVLHAEADAVDDCLDPVRVRRLLYVAPVVIPVGVRCAVAVLVQVEAVIRQGGGQRQQHHQDQQKRKQFFHNPSLLP